MVAINKRPVRLLCSPNPLLANLSFSLFLSSFFLLSPFFSASSLLRARTVPLSLPPPFPLPPPIAPEFPTVVISEPCEASQSPREVFHQRARGRRKNHRPFSRLLFHLVVVQLLRVIVRVNGIAECRGEEGRTIERRKEEEKGIEPRRTVHVLRNQFLRPTYFRLADRDCTCHRDQFP